MDKVIREIQGANGVLTCGQKGLSKLDFEPSNSVGMEKKKGKGKGREEESRERGSTFSLDFPTIGSSVSSEARGRVLSRDKSFKWRPETESFDKLREVGLLILWLFSI